MSDKLTALRAELAKLKVDAFLVPRTDEYQNEYVPACAERLAWLTSFTGSAGTAIVLADQAALFVDGRYTLQAPAEVDTQLFAIHHSGTTPPADWLFNTLPDGAQVGFDPWLHPQSWVETNAKKLASRRIALVPLSYNPIDRCWADRPPAPRAPFVVQPAEFAGESAQSKRLRIAQMLKDSGTDAFVLTAPDSIAWLLNIRGHDVPHTPLPLCFAILHAAGTVDLFVDAAKITDDVRAHLGNAVQLEAPEKLGQAINTLSRTCVLAADSNASAAWIFAAAADDNIRRQTDPCLLPKARKNPAELAGTRAAHLRDGAAMVRLLSTIKAGDDELGVTERLYLARTQGEHFRDLSFDTIAGSGPNGAIVHYRSSEKTNRRLQEGELFLLDSGAQYVDGTTDITRTIAIGTPTPEMKDRFTRVLKGHIAIATALFPKGTTGHQLDAFARHALWQIGADFDHGTGHGVGSYLSVHEGPQRISPRPSPLGVLEEGMILSNEPGYYKSGAYGIRIENLIVVQKATLPGAEREMLGFETITLCPIDRNLIEVSLLSADERSWLNAYHARVLAALAPQLDATNQHWLAAACAPL